MTKKTIDEKLIILVNYSDNRHRRCHDQGLRSHKHIDTYVGNLGDSYSATNMNEGSEMCLLWTNNKQKNEYFQN